MIYEMAQVLVRPCDDEGAVTGPGTSGCPLFVRNSTKAAREVRGGAADGARRRGPRRCRATRGVTDSGTAAQPSSIAAGAAARGAKHGSGSLAPRLQEQLVRLGSWLEFG